MLSSVCHTNSVFGDERQIYKPKARHFSHPIEPKRGCCPADEATHQL